MLHSNDGVQFEAPITVGNGYFAHVSCAGILSSGREVIAIGWEDVVGKHTDPNKKAGYAVYADDGTKITSGAVEGPATATTVYLSPDAKTLEVLWLKAGSSPLVGTLRHTILTLK